MQDSPSAEEVAQLIASQCPQWGGLPLAWLPSSGTENRLFRLGDRLVVRLPQTDGAALALDKEHVWLPRLARRLSLQVPEPVFKGEPQAGYARPWAVFRWIDGRDGWTADIENLDAAAIDLARFVAELRRVPCAGGPKPGVHNAERGTALATLDQRVRQGFAACGDRIDADSATALWERSLAAPAWKHDTWLHGDLQPGNILVRDGRITAVIDFGLLGVGDPAVDLLPAWNLFDGESRRLYREALNVDDAAWHRAQGWAVYQAVMALPFYWDTNRTMVRLAQRLLAEVLADPIGRAVLKWP